VPKVKQPNSSKVQSILHEYAFEFTLPVTYGCIILQIL